MALINTPNTAIMPGQRLIKVKGGYQTAEKYPTPRDTEVPIFDEDEDYLYIKYTDVNGGVMIDRFHVERDPIPQFNPAEYVSKDDFNSFKEEILNGFSSLQQSIQGAVSGNAKQQSNNSYKFNKSDKEQHQPPANV